MNILYICDEFPPGKTGGIGTATHLLANELSKRGHKAFVLGLCAHGYGAPDVEQTAAGVKVYRLRYKTDLGVISAKDNLVDKLLVHFLRFTGVLALDTKAAFATMLDKIKFIIKTEQIDVVEFPDWNNFFFNLRPRDFVLPPLGVPLVVKMHGAHSYLRVLAGKKPKSNFFKLENYLYQRADARSAVSAFTAKTAQGIYALQTVPEVVYNGVEILPPDPNLKRYQSKHVLFSGSLLPNKGIYVLAAQWHRVLQKHPQASLHIYGKGSIEKVKSFIPANARESVHFYGHINRAELLQQLGRADVAVFPSFSETFGIAAVEAMAMQCPVIFTGLSSGPEIIEAPKEGWLIDPNKPAELVEALCEALDSETERSARAKAGYEKVLAKFSIEAAVNKQMLYYQNVLEKFRQHGK